MAIQWGGWSGYFRLGIDIIVSGTTATVIVYGQSDGYGHDWSGSLNFTGSWSGSKTVSFYSGYGQTVTKELHRSAATFTGTRTYGANISYWSGSASVSRSVTIAPSGPSAPPPAPEGLKATKTSDTAIRLNWTPRGSSSAPVQTQIVQRRYWTGGGWTTWTQMASLPTGSSAPSSWTDTTVKAGNTYEYRVAGKNSRGQSGWSNVAEQYTRAIPPTNVKATLLTTTSAKVTWSQSGQGALRIYFERRLDTGSGWSSWQSRFAYADAWAASWTDTSIPAGARAQYRAWTVPSKIASWINDAALQSAYSEASNILASLQPPNAPSNLSPNGEIVTAEETVHVSWMHNSTDTTEQKASEVQYRQQGSSAWITVLPPGTVPNASLPGFLADPISPGVWEWRVRTKGQHADWSPWSATATFTAINRPDVNITKPSSEANWSDPKVTAEWSFFQTQGRPQSAWRAVLHGPDGPVEQKSGSGATTKTTFSTRLEHDTDYRVTVEAATGQVWSEIAAVEFHVFFLPPEPPVVEGVWNEAAGSHELAISSGDWVRADVFMSGGEVFYDTTFINPLLLSIDGGTVLGDAGESSDDAVVTDFSADDIEGETV